MAKAFFIFAVLLLAAAATVDADPSPAPAPARKPGVKLPQTNVKVLVLNKSSKDLIIKVKELGPKAKSIVAAADKWTGVGEFKVSLTLNNVVHLSVSVKNEKNLLMKKELALNLLKRVKGKVEGKKFAVLKAVEDRKKMANGKVQKMLNIWLDAKIVVSIKL